MWYLPHQRRVIALIAKVGGQGVDLFHQAQRRTERADMMLRLHRQILGGRRVRVHKQSYEPEPAADVFEVDVGCLTFVFLACPTA